nr:MAG TPA: hypothetical protein [Caudoviricetes sp.]
MILISRAYLIFSPIFGEIFLCQILGIKRRGVICSSNYPVGGNLL